MLVITFFVPFLSEVWPLLMTAHHIDIWVVHGLCVCVAKDKSVSPALLRDDFPQFFWLDPLSPGALGTASKSMDFYDNSSLD